MNKILLAICFLFVLKAQAQERNDLNNLLSGENNFLNIQQKAEDYFNKHPELKNTFKDNDYVKYKRWEWYWKARVMPDGSFPDLKKQAEIYASYQGVKNKNASSNWRNINQVTTTGGYHGMGRTISVAVHPSDTNIIYVGGEIGGIWKSVDAGTTWTALGDALPYAAVGNIVINPINTNHLFITIGKCEGWWHFGLGIYESFDAGQSWQATNRISSFTDEIVYRKLMMHPSDTSILFSAENKGLYKSTDAGNTWSQVINKETIDIEFKPFHPNTMYAVSKVSNMQVMKSVDGGDTWTQITNLTASNTSELSVTPADSNMIAVATVYSASKAIYISNNGGLNFHQTGTDFDANAVFHLSHLQSNKMFCGYVSNYRSIDTGFTWFKITNWFNDGVLPTVHADNHYAVTHSLYKHLIYYCNDGGLYRYNENTNTWKDLSMGLVITQFYKIAMSQSDSVYIVGGTQDNGGRQRIASPNIWTSTNGGDGMEVAVNWQNDYTMYTSYWGGKMYRSYDRWDLDTYYDISPTTERGAWVTPYVLSPNNPHRIIAAFDDVYVSNSEGDIWDSISTDLTFSSNNKLEVLDVAKSNPNYIYTGRVSTIYKTTNLGLSWSQFAVPSANGTFEDLSCVVVHPKDEDMIYVTKSGYGNKSKVYQRIGNTWKNISYNIPNIPVNCILLDSLSDTQNIDMYIGTDVGVFYKQNNDTTWQYYGLGMPNTQVSDLEIYQPTAKLRAATYGRGVWEIDAMRPLSNIAVKDENVAIENIKILQNPIKDLLQIEYSGSGNASWQVLNSIGEIMASGNIILKENKNILQLETQQWPQAMYHFVLYYNNQKQSISFIK